MEIYDHVREAAEKGFRIMQKYNFLYLQMYMRTGKTNTSLLVCEKMGFKKVLLVTPANAKKDFLEAAAGFDIDIDAISWDSLHKVETGDIFDAVIVDEVHKINSNPRPKPSRRANEMRRICRNLPAILLSGTPTPEGLGQYYRQLNFTKYAPFYNVKFRDWVQEYVKIKTIRTSMGYDIKDYKNGISEKILPITQKYAVTVTQEQAEFIHSGTELSIKQVKMNNLIYRYLKEFRKNDVVIRDVDGVRLKASLKDTMSKRQKMRQLCGGGLIFENEFRERVNIILDYSKIIKIVHDTQQFSKVFIVYNFVFEREILENYLAHDVTFDVEEFRNTDVKYFAGNTKAVCEGINLSNADLTVMYSVQDSAKDHLQIIERIKHRDREKIPKLWVYLTQGGIDNDIFDTVHNKKRNFTNIHYRNIYE